MITLLAPGEKQERAVPFLHDLHANALKKQDKDCAFCHPEQGKQGRLSLAYMRRMNFSAPPGGRERKQLYHANCIGCHERMQRAGEKSGPAALFCGKCHGARGAYVSAFEPFEMNSVLHMRHIYGGIGDGPDLSCKECHHLYDPDAGGLVYGKGREGSCRYCHKKTKTFQSGAAVISLADAVHLSCIACHQKRIAQNKKHGPISCSGCHAPEAQKAIQRRSDRYQASHRLPELDQGQARYGFVSPAAGALAPGWKHKVDFLPLVPFPHREHERQGKNCRLCHHASLESCAKRCHTFQGASEGDFWTLRAVMHGKNNARGCVGCHAEKQGAKQCAGCHPPGRRGILRQSQCDACHRVGLEAMRKDALAKAPLARNFEAEAKKALDSRPRVTATYPDAAIPEQVRIGKLSKDWAPASMPHRRIVKKLVANAVGSKLAAYFHASPGTFCQGCHHHAPAGKIPPACSHCHGTYASRTAEDLPELAEAYHRACIGCHERMGLDAGGEAPGADDCRGCHKAKQ